MKTKYAPFRASDHLNAEEVIAEYLTASAEDENPDVLRSAHGEIARHGRPGEKRPGTVKPRARTEQPAGRQAAAPDYPSVA